VATHCLLAYPMRIQPGSEPRCKPSQGGVATPGHRNAVRRQLCSKHNKVITVIDCQITLMPSRSITCCLYAMERGKAGIQIQSYVTLGTLLLDFHSTNCTSTLCRDRFNEVISAVCSDLIWRSDVQVFRTTNRWLTMTIIDFIKETRFYKQL